MSVTTNGTDRQAAVDAWLAAASRGEDLTGTQLAERFSRSESWGRARIREARQLAGDDGPPAATTVQATPEAGPGDERGLVPAGNPPPAAVPERYETGIEDVSPWVGRVTITAVLAVALAAARASFGHLDAIAQTAGEGPWAWLLPVSVDGLIVASSMVLYRASKLQERPGIVPWAGLVLGLGASVVGNVVAVNPELINAGHLKVAVAAWPPLALALAFEMALRQVRGS